MSVEYEADHVTFSMPAGRLVGTRNATPVTKVFPVRLALGTEVLHRLLVVLNVVPKPVVELNVTTLFGRANVQGALVVQFVAPAVY